MIPRRLSAMVLLVLPLAACATGRSRMPVFPSSGGFCAVAHLIHPSRKDTPGTLRQVLAHNEKVRRFCAAEGHQ